MAKKKLYQKGRVRYFDFDDNAFLEKLLNNELEALEAGESEFQQYAEYYIKKIRGILDKMGLSGYYTR